MNQPAIDEALTLLRRTLAATEEALSVSASIEQLQERFESAVLPVIGESEAWSTASTSQQEAKKALLQARTGLEEMLAQITRGQSPDTQVRAWADQFIDLNERLQTALTNAGQQATRLFESMRPTLVAHYLEHATRVPRWGETWPFDVDEATQALERIATGSESGATEELDIQLARFRWQVGWQQQKIASVVGLSQPSVAARLGRIETLISLEVGAKHVRDQAAKEQFKLKRWHVLNTRSARGTVGEVVLEAKDYVVQLDLLVASGETGTARRTGTMDRGMLLDYFRLETSERRQRALERTINGVAVYYRDRGLVGYYTKAVLADAMRRFGSLPAETVLQSLRDTVEPAWMLAELVSQGEPKN